MVERCRDEFPTNGYSEERIMNKLAKNGPHTGAVLSLAAAAMIMPAAAFAGPGCINNQRMTPGYYPNSGMGPQMAYGQRAPYPYYPAPVPYAGMMPAPYNRPMTALHSPPPARGGQAVVAANTTPSGEAAASDNSMTTGESVTVRIDGMRFDPPNITVKPGTTVTWVHDSQMPHTISGNADGLSSGTLYNGQQFSHTFSAPGSYNYFCGLHPSMTGNVVVEEAATDS
jgi:plastocyanin